MLIRPAIGDTDPIRYRRPTPDGQFSGNIIDEAMRCALPRVRIGAVLHPAVFLALADGAGFLKYRDCPSA